MTERIAQIVGKMVGGGVESMLMNYYRHIDKSVFQFDFYVDSDSTTVPKEEIVALGGRLFYLPPYQEVSKYRKCLKTYLLQNKYRVMHSHINSLSAIPLSVGKGVGIPIRIAHSHALAGRGELTRNIVKALVKPTVNIFSTDRFACSVDAGRWLFGKCAFEVLPNAIDLQKYAFDTNIRETTRNKIGVGSDKFLLGHVGRLVKTKNQQFVIDVLVDLISAGFPCELLLVGDGPDRKKLMDYVKTKKLSDLVHFTGIVDDPSALYMAMDAFVMPSLYEGFGMAGLEAQATGLPCFFSNNISTNLQMFPNCYFMGIDEGPQKWAKMIVLKSNDNFGHMEPRNHVSIPQEYSIQYSSKLLERLYTNVLIRVN